MSMKDNDYICPKCKGHLNIGDYLVFATKTQKKHRGLLMMSPVVGEYKYIHHEKFQLEKGEMVDFECPICQADLTSAKNQDHAMILMVGEEDSAEYELFFSKIAGNQSTYLMAHVGIESFGNDALDFEELYYE